MFLFHLLYYIPKRYTLIISLVFLSFRWRDPRRTVITLDGNDSSINLEFLKATAALMDEWPKANILANKMFTQDTRKAVLLTSRNMAETMVDILTKYQDIGIHYICAGKLTSDQEEHAFGRRRQMAGTNYWTEVRQFFESETIIRSVNLVKLSGYTLKEVKEQMTPVLEDKQKDDEELSRELVEQVDANSIDIEPGDMAPGEAGGVGHFSGYVARSASKKLRCEDCKAALVMGNKELPHVLLEGGEDVRSALPEMFSGMIELQDRGGLLYPSDECIHLVMMGLEIFKAIVQPAALRGKLMSAHSAEGVFALIYTEILQNNPDMARLECNSGCSLVTTVVPAVARTLFRVFGKNVVAKANSDHRLKESDKKRFGTNDHRNCRSKSNFKVQKLNGQKS